MECCCTTACQPEIKEDEVSKITSQIALMLFCGAVLVPQPLRAQVQCALVDKIKYSSDKMPTGWEKVDSTTADDDVQKYCMTNDWNKPLDDWYYGDYDFLFSSWKDRYPTEDARGKAMKSRPASYIREIRRYSCTEDGKVAGFFGFHLDAKTASPSGELTFLCVPKNLRSAGNGGRLFNTALSEAGSKAGGDTINLRIKALVSAIPFYNSFNMGCSFETREKVTVTNFSTGPRKLTKGVARISRRVAFNENLEGGKPSCKRINYGCIAKDNYKAFLLLGDAMLAAGYDNPLMQMQENCDASIDLATVKKNICDFLRQRKFDEDEDIRSFMDASCK